MGRISFLGFTSRLRVVNRLFKHFSEIVSGKDRFNPGDRVMVQYPRELKGLIITVKKKSDEKPLFGNYYYLFKEEYAPFSLREDWLSLVEETEETIMSEEITSDSFLEIVFGGA